MHFLLDDYLLVLVTVMLILCDCMLWPKYIQSAVYGVYNAFTKFNWITY